MTESAHPARHDEGAPPEVVDAETSRRADVAPEGEAAITGGAAGLTGNDRVDEAVRSVHELGDRPVEEHVEVFEQAHDALRGALNDAAAGRTSPDSGQPPRPTPPVPGAGQR